MVARTAGLFEVKGGYGCRAIASNRVEILFGHLNGVQLRAISRKLCISRCEYANSEGLRRQEAGFLAESHHQSAPG